MPTGRFTVIVLDSVGVGELPDADLYNDAGSNTLANIAEDVGGLDLPNLESLGLGKIIPVKGLSGDIIAKAAYGIMAEAAPGKDSISGHWELMGYIAQQPQPTYPEGFPFEVITALEKETGRKFIGNVAASGTEIIEKLGKEHVSTGSPILYTSADSVLQIAAHEDVIPVEDLYRICKQAREIMSGENAVGRIIARPFQGRPGDFQRTVNRKDYSIPAPQDTVLDLLKDAGVSVLGIGKIEDLFAGRGLTDSIHTRSNLEGMQTTLRAIQSDISGMIFTNLVDFDMLWGHRNDVAGYYRGLCEFDRFLPELIEALKPGDILVLTADHGCDPTTPSTDHSREHVPVLAYGDAVCGDVNIGLRSTFADLAASIVEYFQITGTGAGESFLKKIMD